MALLLPALGDPDIANAVFAAIVTGILGIGAASLAVVGLRRPKTSRQAAVEDRIAAGSVQAQSGAADPPSSGGSEDPKETSVLDFFSKGAIQELRPRSDPQYGARYIEIENLTKVEPRNVPALLERLAARGVLLRRTYERKVVCEICNSANLAPRYECTTCKSTNLERERVIEHVTCGHSGPEGDFEVRGNLLACPQCGKEFRPSGPEATYKASEILYSCRDCGASTRQPGIFFHCADCDAILPSNGVAFANLYSYALSRSGDLQSVVLLELISSMLKEMGYQVDTPGTMVGKSGIQHKFGLTWSFDSQVGAVSVVQVGRATDDRALKETFTSVFDCSPSVHVMITIPNASESVKKLANQYGTHLIEGGDVKGILRLFRTHVIGLRSSQSHQRQLSPLPTAPRKD